MPNHTAHDSIASQLRFQGYDIVPPNIEFLRNKSVSRLEELQRASKAPAVSRNDMMKKHNLFSSTKQYQQDRNTIDLLALGASRPTIKTNLTQKDLVFADGRSTEGIRELRKPRVSQGKKLVDTNVYFNRF